HVFPDSLQQTLQKRQRLRLQGVIVEADGAPTTRLGCDLPGQLHVGLVGVLTALFFGFCDLGNIATIRDGDASGFDPGEIDGGYVAFAACCFWHGQRTPYLRCLEIYSEVLRTCPTSWRTYRATTTVSSCSACVQASGAATNQCSPSVCV